MTLSKRKASPFPSAGQVLALCFLVSAPALAAEADSTAVLGMGGAGTANPWDANAVRRSPAAMQLVVQYTARVDGRYGEGIAVGGTLQDTRTSNVGGALSYTRQWVSREPDSSELPGWLPPDQSEVVDERQENAYRLGLGTGFFRQTVVSSSGSYDVRRLAVGVGGVFERNTSSLVGVEQSFGLDASLAGRPTKSLVLAATGHDLIPTSVRDPSVEAGLWWEPIEALGVAVDGAWDRSYAGVPLGGRAGVQYLLSGVVPLRGGYAVYGSGEDADQRLGLGVGVRNDVASIDYAFTLHTVGPLAGRMEHSVGLWASF